MIKVPVHEAQVNLDRLIEAALAGEEVYIVIETDVVVQLARVPSVDSTRTIGSAKGQVWMSDDFDEPLDDFAAYM
jgi:antitoxin (DNA-binding transcriptional repressor) of toxin-antitoxin stability system